MIRLQVNERELHVKNGTTLFELRDEVMPLADMVIFNGYTIRYDTILHEGDVVVLITRNRRPTSAELESLLVARHTPGVHAKVKQATVGVAGVGGLGSAVAIALVRTGIGRIVLADFDLVAPSNLNRQQYFLDQLGTPKVVALAETLQRINPYTEVVQRNLEVTRANASKLFRDCQIVAECFDEPRAKAMLVQALAGEKTVVASSGVAGCGSANEIRTTRRLDGLYVVGDEISEAAPGRGLMAPRVGVAAHHQANAILRLILGEDPCHD
ncbi:MAG: sulfur carrier protein ThiS adenylyltransferase ThiF [Candidatus Lernaella stagnicola]|nr:sulfur carrier protein ThiS adenylyltransferase ThiF [Candidatus Lernaella stagnicola]